MNIFFDLDGTLLDVRPRYRALHERALAPRPATLPFEAYWALKQQGVPEEEILRRHYPAVDAGAYMRRRLEMVETAEMLAMDTLFPGALEMLRDLRKKHDVSVVTVRKKTDLLRAETERLGLDTVLTRVLTADPGAAPWETKAALMAPFAGPGDWMVGDTEADIRGGKLLGMRTAAVTSGIRDKAYLLALEPDLLLESALGLPAALARLTA